ncbi:MAG: hypothetical protein EBY89_04610 [Actinobacteria bacterium]|nr:hypothetical protein [Actinomycetota bacterium]
MLAELIERGRTDRLQLAVLDGDPQWLAAVRPLKKQLQQVEDELGVQQTEQSRLHELLGRSLAPTELAQAGRQLKDVEQALGRLVER